MKFIINALPRIMFGGIALGLLAFLSFNCMETPLSPVAPSSQISLQVPLIDITKYIGDVQNKTPGVTYNSTTGEILYSATQYSAPRYIDSIKLQMSPSGQQVGVGVFSVANIPATNTSATVAQMGLSPIDYPGANSTLPGVPPPFPASYISRPGDTINYSSQFNYVAVNNGTLTLQFTNNFPLRIDFNHPLILRNNQFQPFIDTSWIAVFDFAAGGTIDSGGTPGATRTITQSLAGKLLRGQMKFDSISFKTEQRSSSFSLKSSNGISTQFSSSAIIADSADAVIPSQPISSTNNSTLVLDDSVVVESASFSAGLFQLQINNNLGIDVDAYFVLHGLLQNDSDFTIKTVMSGKTSPIWNIEGKNLRIQPDLSTLGTKLKYDVAIKTIDSKGLKKTITKNDFIRASIIPISPLVVKEVTGKIKPQVIQINSGTKSGFSDISNLKNGKLILKNISLIGHFTMSGGFPMDYNFTVYAKKNGQVLATLPIGIDNVKFKRIYPGNFIIPISQADKFDNFLSSFFPSVPDSFYINGTIFLNPLDEFTKPNNNYTIYDSSNIAPALDVNFPFGAGIQNGLLTEMTSLGKDAIPTEFTKSVGNGSLTFTIINSIPVQIGFQSRCIRYNASTHAIIDTAIYIPQDNTSYTILPAKYDTISQKVTASQRSTFTVSLNSAEMQKFNQSDSMFVRFFINTSNNGNYAKVKSTDKIRVFASGNITYTINKP